LNRKNTKHVRIEINGDDIITETKPVSVSASAINGKTKTTEQIHTPAEQTEILTEPADNQKIIGIDDYEGEDGDDTDEFDPDDTELV